LKILDHGYWVSKWFFYQSFFHGLKIIIQTRSISFFSALNPAIAMGGFLDDKKTDIYKIIPASYLPLTKQVNDLKSALALMKSGDFEYPIIIKPDIGLKGIGVAKISSPKLMEQYFSAHKQKDSFVEYPFVVGDGNKTLLELINLNKNPFLKKAWITNSFNDRLNEILDINKKLIIDPIGNYSRGAKFYSRQDQISQEFIESANDLFKEIEGIDFCRIDLKTKNLEALQKGKYKIIELNGAKSEPLHIYDPDLTWSQIVNDIKQHWKIINSIVKQRVALKYVFPNVSSTFKSYFAIKKIK